MKEQRQLAGMRGVFLAAAELSKLGFIVCTTSRNSQGADLLITDLDCSNTISVQVKTNSRSRKLWIIGKKGKEIVSKTHIYVLINIVEPNKKNPAEEFEYYVVPSKVIAASLQHLVNKGPKRAEWWYVTIKDMVSYRDRWDILSGTKVSGMRYGMGKKS